MRPLVSIVIPTFNRARDLDRALKSVLAQTYSNWEALIIDNHSTDNTDEVVRSFNDSRIILYKINNDGMISVSRNLGIKHAQGEYIAFLDSDDWWLPRKLDESLKYLEQGADVIYHELFVVTKDCQRLFWRKAKARDLRSPAFKDLIVDGNALINSSVVLRKSVLTGIGFLPEDREMNPCCDYDAWLHIAKHTEKFKRVPKTLGYYWMGGGNVTTSERTITSLDRFESLYASDLVDLSKDDIWWLNYAKGRAYYHLGFYEIAKKHLGLIRWHRVPSSVYWNSLRMLLFINLYHSKVAWAHNKKH